MKAVGGGTRRLGLIGVTVLALIVAIAALLHFVAASGGRQVRQCHRARLGRDGLRHVFVPVADRRLGARAESRTRIGIQAAVFSPRCGFFQHTVGSRNLATKAHADSSTRYGVASISKTLTASAVWTLIQQHRIGFDETIDHWFSPSELFGVHQITVGDLLIGNTHYQTYDGVPQWKFPSAQHLTTGAPVYRQLRPRTTLPASSSTR